MLRKKLCYWCNATICIAIQEPFLHYNAILCNCSANLFCSIEIEIPIAKVQHTINPSPNVSYMALVKSTQQLLSAKYVFTRPAARFVLSDDCVNRRLYRTLLESIATRPNEMIKTKPTPSQTCVNLPLLFSGLRSLFSESDYNARSSAVERNTLKHFPSWRLQTLRRFLALF